MPVISSNEYEKCHICHNGFDIADGIIATALVYPTHVQNTRVQNTRLHKRDEHMVTYCHIQCYIDSVTTDIENNDG